MALHHSGMGFGVKTRGRAQRIVPGGMWVGSRPLKVVAAGRGGPKDGPKGPGDGSPALGGL